MHSSKTSTSHPLRIDSVAVGRGQNVVQSDRPHCRGQESGAANHLAHSGYRWVWAVLQTTLSDKNRMRRSAAGRVCAGGSQQWTVPAVLANYFRGAAWVMSKFHQGASAHASLAR
jgi:hypothetical protein